MKVRFALTAVALLLAQQSYAKDQQPSLMQAEAVATTTSPANASQAYQALDAQAVAALRSALQGDSSKLTQEQVDKAKQSKTQADYAWLKASGYDFQTKANQQAGIELLSGFSALPQSVLDENLKTVTAINLNATQGARNQAVADADGISYLYFLADSLGPRLGKAFITAYDKGELSKAAALLKASEVSTSAAKKHFNYLRPFLIKGNSIHLVPDEVILKDGKPYGADGGSFPSGHTNTGYTDALLLAEMIPERFDAIVERGARYGYSRIVLGVHYPLDIMGSRMLTQRNVAHYLNDPKYRALFIEARDQLRAALEKECGASLAQCAQNDRAADPYRSPEMKTFYRYTMSYGLPQQKVANTKVKVPQGAEVLLEFALPNLSAAQRRALMVQTAAPAGYPLSGSTPDQAFWQRLNLPAAYAQAKGHH
ncbi:acid phosphatase [Candidatus Pantoea multigeneris]|uniref:Phosphatase PAP2 family protein n=1 Tax=Candidatus Pantoea multigeneris TaxID=2608357 RepID=A0ABX0RA83_9GAMM|nr:phosphatase PAP2 family protein [Pantoea multigeneris]NIF21251.1 phosphatase PAP2 family protein [Pantoea multigeneris]